MFLLNDVQISFRASSPSLWIMANLISLSDGNECFAGWTTSKRGEKIKVSFTNEAIDIHKQRGGRCSHCEIYRKGYLESCGERKADRW